MKTGSKKSRVAESQRLIVELIQSSPLTLTELNQEVTKRLKTPVTDRTIDSYIYQIRRGILIDQVNIVMYKGKYYIGDPEESLKQRESDEIKALKNRIFLLTKRVQLLEKTLLKKPL
jgi:hypothetical protein